MVKKAELLVCLLLTTFMVTVKGNTNSTSVNKTSNGVPINYPSTLIPLNASTIGKAIFPKLEIKRERNAGQEGEETTTSEDPSEETSAEPDKEVSENVTSVMPESSSISESSSALVTDEDDIAESSVVTGSESTDDTTTAETEGTESTKDPGAKEGSAVCFKPALVYFLLLPLCITTKVKLLW